MCVKSEIPRKSLVENSCRVFGVGVFSITFRILKVSDISGHFVSHRALTNFRRTILFEVSVRHSNTVCPHSFHLQQFHISALLRYRFSNVYRKPLSKSISNAQEVSFRKLIAGEISFAGQPFERFLRSIV